MADFKSVQPGDPPWLVEAFKLLGLKESPGEGNNPTVVALFAEAGFAGVKTDATAWCAAMKGAMLRRAGYKGSGSLAARSYLDYGQKIALADARRGDIAIFKRGNSSWQGHVADFLKAEGDYIWVLGGNQSDAVTVARYKKAALLGIRRPTAAEKAKPATPIAEKPAKPASGQKIGGRAKPPTEGLVLAIQQALADKGYHQVGLIDGDYGRNTRDTIIAFEADHELALTGKATPEILGAILASEPRPVSEARAEGKPEDNKAVKASNANLTVGGVLTGGALLGVADPIVSTIEGGAGLFSRLKDALAPIISLWPLLALIAAGLVIYFALRSRKAVVEDYQSGKLAR